MLRDLTRRAIFVLQAITSNNAKESENAEEIHHPELEKPAYFDTKSNNTNFYKEQIPFQSNKLVDPHTFCKLGHLHLLLGEFDEGCKCYYFVYL